jgi:hypothetical protein
MSPETSGERSSLPAAPPDSVVGKAIYSAEGDKIGKVTKVSGAQVIVPVGGFLGIGTHDIALNWGEITTTGSGSDMELHTILTKDQIKNLPEHEK